MGSTTVTSDTPLAPFHDAVISALPTARAVTMPAAIDATCWLDVVQVTLVGDVSFPCLSRALSLSWRVPPPLMIAALGATTRSAVWPVSPGSVGEVPHR